MWHGQHLISHFEQRIGPPYHSPRRRCPPLQLGSPSLCPWPGKTHLPTVYIHFNIEVSPCLETSVSTSLDPSRPGQLLFQAVAAPQQLPQMPTQLPQQHGLPGWRPCAVESPQVDGREHLSCTLLDSTCLRHPSAGHVLAEVNADVQGRLCRAPQLPRHSGQVVFWGEV